MFPDSSRKDLTNLNETNKSVLNNKENENIKNFLKNKTKKNITNKNYLNTLNVSNELSEYNTEIESPLNQNSIIVSKKRKRTEIEIERENLSKNHNAENRIENLIYPNSINRKDFQFENSKANYTNNENLRINSKLDKMIDSTITSEEQDHNNNSANNKNNDKKDEDNYDLFNLDLEINQNENLFPDAEYIWNFEDYFTI